MDDTTAREDLKDLIGHLINGDVEMARKKLKSYVTQRSKEIVSDEPLSNTSEFKDNGDVYKKQDSENERVTKEKGFPVFKDAKGTLKESEDKNFDIWKYVKKVENPETKKKQWALLDKTTGRHLAYFDGEGKPGQEWVDKQLKRIKYFGSKGK